MNKEQTKCPVCGRFVNIGVTAKYEKLLAENKWLEDELDKYHNANIELGKECASLSNELAALKSRGFFARLFNIE